MNKTSLIIIVSVLVALGLIGFLFNNFFVINDWKVVSRVEHNSIILEEELTKQLKEGDVDESIKVAEKLIEVRKNDDQAKLDLADAYLEKASLEFKEEEYGNKALALANEVLQKNPNNFEVYLTIGYAYEVLQDYSKAFENYSKAIEMEPDYSISYTKRGHAHDLVGDLNSAEADYMKAIQISDQNDIALMNLARIAQRKGDFENAKKYAESVIQISRIAYNRATAYEIIGLAYLDSEDNQSAIDNFSKSIDAYEKYVSAYSNRAYAKILLNNYEVKDINLEHSIQDDINNALIIHEFNSFAHVVNGLLKEAVGDNQKAKEFYEKALSVVDKDITLGATEKIDMKNKINESINSLTNNQ